MATKQKHNALVLGASVVIAVIIFIAPWKQHRVSQRLASRVYKTANGWGYDILQDNRVVIHQASIPVVQGHIAFAEKKQAEETAGLVLERLRAGHSPALTRSDLEKVIPFNIMESTGLPKHE